MEVYEIYFLCIIVLLVLCTYMNNCIILLLIYFLYIIMSLVLCAHMNNYIRLWPVYFLYIVMLLVFCTQKELPKTAADGISGYLNTTSYSVPISNTLDRWPVHTGQGN